MIERWRDAVNNEKGEGKERVPETRIEMVNRGNQVWTKEVLAARFEKPARTRFQPNHPPINC
jgi:hypothetical protein